MPRGGKRDGAGRKVGVPNKSRGEVAELARQYTEPALKALAAALENPRERVAAATALLDRGYGKPAQHSHVTLTDKRDATDWTRDELVALLHDAAAGSTRAATANGRERKPDQVH